VQDFLEVLALVLVTVVLILFLVLLPLQVAVVAHKVQTVLLAVQVAVDKVLVHLEAQGLLDKDLLVVLDKHQDEAVVAVVAQALLEFLGLEHLQEMAALVLAQPLLEQEFFTLVVAVVVMALVLEKLLVSVVQVEVVQVQLAHQLHNFQEQMVKQILAVVLAVVLITVQPQSLRHLEAQASSSFVTLHHNQHQLQQLVHHKLTTLMATKFTLGHHLEL
jgi:hypothetical protein